MNWLPRSSQSQKAETTWLRKYGTPRFGADDDTRDIIFVPQWSEVTGGCRSLTNAQTCEENAHWSRGGDGKGGKGDEDFDDATGEDGKARLCQWKTVHKPFWESLFTGNLGYITRGEHHCMASGLEVAPEYPCGGEYDGMPTYTDYIYYYDNNPPSFASRNHFCKFSPVSQTKVNNWIQDQPTCGGPEWHSGCIDADAKHVRKGGDWVNGAFICQQVGDHAGECAMSYFPRRVLDDNGNTIGPDHNLDRAKKGTFNLSPNPNDNGFPPTADGKRYCDENCIALPDPTKRIPP